MSINNRLARLAIHEQVDISTYEYIKVFKNPNKLPITQIHLEKSWRQLKKDRPRDLDFLSASAEEISKAYFETKTDIIPALDVRWLPKCVLKLFEPYSFDLNSEENQSFLLKNTQFIECLDYLLNCNYHQFWCTILFEPSAAIALRSFLLTPVAPYQVKYLESEYLEVYKVVFAKFLLVYRKLITFKYSDYEHMPESYAVEKLLKNKLLNLPIVITLVFLYENTDLDFVNRIVALYFNESTQEGFLLKEIETLIDQSLLVINMIRGHFCGFEENETVVPIVEKRPRIFSLKWVYSIVSYLLNTVSTTNVLLRFYKPAIEIAMNKGFPYKLPSLYVNIYREIYEMLHDREELKIQNEIFQKIMEEVNLGRTQFIELYHIFVSGCLDEALKYIGDKPNQEPIVEVYLKLLTTALEEDYFICDYNTSNNVATQNEMFQSVCDIDKTCTEFIVSCINKLPRNAKLQELSKVKRQSLETVFRDFRPPVIEKSPVVIESLPGPSKDTNREVEIEQKIRNIIDMFPEMGDGFILQCLESYDYSTSDVINAILEGNLPPHLCEIPRDTIRIPPEPEPERPILAYRGKKPQYDDALKLLNDKTEIRDKLRTMVLEGIQYSYDNPYDDEYDDRFDDDVAIRVPDQPLDEEIQIFNPNRQRENNALEGDSSSDDEDEQQQNMGDRSKMNFCEDPAVIRERREAQFRQKTGQKPKGPPSTTKGDVVGKAKGQGQENNVLLNRQKKNANKSGRANHNRKSGATWKRFKGMIPS